MLKRVWNEDEGVLTFEWILLLTILVIGVVGGLSAVRDALEHEAAGVAIAEVSLDQSWFVNMPLQPVVGNSMNASDTACGAAGGVWSGFADPGGPDQAQTAATYGVWRTNGITPQVINNSADSCGL